MASGLGRVRRADTMKTVRNILGDYFLAATDLAMQSSLSKLRKQAPAFAKAINQRNSAFLDVIALRAIPNEGYDMVDHRSITFPRYIPLHPGYLARKIRKRRAGGGYSKFFQWSGDLKETFWNKDVLKAWGSINGTDIRITLRNNVSPTSFTRRGQLVTQARSLSGRYASPTDLEFFEISFPVFPKMGREHTPEWSLFGGDFQADNHALHKLLGYNYRTKMTGRRFYRPLIPQYLQWHYTVVLPEFVRNYKWTTS